MHKSQLEVRFNCTAQTDPEELEVHWRAIWVQALPLNTDSQG